MNEIDEKLPDQKRLLVNETSPEQSQENDLSPTKKPRMYESTEVKLNPPAQLKIGTGKTNLPTQNSLEVRKERQDTNEEWLINYPESKKVIPVSPSEISQINNDTKNQFETEVENERLNLPDRLLFDSAEIQVSNQKVLDNIDAQIEDEGSDPSQEKSSKYLIAQETNRDCSERDSPISKQFKLMETEGFSLSDYSLAIQKEGVGVLKKSLKTPPTTKKKQENKNKSQRKTPSKSKDTQNKKKQNTSQKLKPAVKENTVHGDEYQRIIQILVRHRGYKIPGFKLGTEVRDVGNLDDLVCVTNNHCRFIQVKHSLSLNLNPSFEENQTNNQNDPETKQRISPPPNVLNTLFKTECSLNKEHKEKPTFELVLYFISFCRLKKSKRFNSSDIEEITFLTNMKLVPEHKTNKDNKFEIENKFEDLLVLRTDFESDHFLWLEKGSGIKYSLNINALKKYNVFMDVLQTIYTDQFPTKPEMANQVINEYMEKVCVVVDYPNVHEIKKLVFTEILYDLSFHPQDLHLLGNSLVHSEIEKLMIRKERKDDEFLSNDDWKITIDKVKQFIEKCKVTGITDYETHKLMKRYRSILFDQERIKDMYEDMAKFLFHHEELIFHCSSVQNEMLVTIKTLNIIHQIKEEANGQNLLRGNVVSYTSLHNIINDRFLTEHFLAGSINTLIITAGKDQVDVDKEGISEELATNLVNGLTSQYQKIILISASNNLFTDHIKVLSGEKYIEKNYNHDFSCLNQTAKKEILAKTVFFQGERIPFGSLFKDDLCFANNVIDENVLLKITDSEETFCLADKSAFVSPGYNEDYYISREFFQKKVNFDVIKERVRDELFFMTTTKGVGQNLLKRILKENEIGEEFIHEWPKKPKKGKRKIENNGIVLRGLADESNEQIFREIAQRNILVHWVLVSSTYLVHVDSSCKHREYKALQTMLPTFTEEVQFLSSKPLEKILILAGDSGVGKSTVLTHIANNMLKLYPVMPMWIVKINLRMFYKKKNLGQIGDLTTVDSTVNLISEMGSLSDSSNLIAKKIIKEGLRTSQRDNFNLVLLLDGFNEISPSFQDETCSLINTLHFKCNVKQIWVTTQIQGKVRLENMLEVPAYFLDNLDCKKQVNLMVKYWTTKYKSYDPPVEHDVNELQEDAQRALQTWKKSINDKDEQSFTQVSLNVIILSDILLTNRQIIGNIDLCKLYEIFINKKFSLYKEEISGPQRHLTDVEQVKDKLFEDFIKEILQDQSAKTILTTYQKNQETDKLLKRMDALDRFKAFVEDLQLMGIEINYQTIISKIGLLSVKEDFDFTHESFAQYFFSGYLINNLNNQTLKTFFLNHILSENNLYLCRKFLNNSIKEHFEGKKEMKYNLFKSGTITQLPDTKNVRKKVKTWAVSKVVEEKLDYIIILLLHIMSGSLRNHFLGQWVRNEVQICCEEEGSVKQVVSYLVKEEKARVPCKLRMILKINKSHDDKDTKLKNILDEQWFTGDDKSQD